MGSVCHSNMNKESAGLSGTFSKMIRHEREAALTLNAMYALYNTLAT